MYNEGKYLAKILADGDEDIEHCTALHGVEEYYYYLFVSFFLTLQV